MSYSSEVLADSPLAYWHLDETSGTTLADSSGNSHPMTLGAGSSALTLNQTGKVGQAVKGYTSGTAGYAYVAGASWANPTNWTIEGWFNRGTGGNGRLVTREAGPGQTVANDYIWSLQVNSNNLQVVVFKTAGGGARVITHGTALAASTWYHIALTWDGTTLRLYVNGTASGTDTPGSALTSSNNTDIVLLNARDTGGGLTYNDLLILADEVAFYGAALTSTRILAHYNAGIAAPGPGAGVGTGAFNWAGAAVGKKIVAGVAAGAFAFSGAAVGSTARRGAATGSFAFAGAAIGNAAKGGSGSGAFNFSGAAVGVAPILGPAEGAATGAFNFAGSAVGSIVRSGAGTPGAFDWSGAAVGESPAIPPNDGAATGAFGWAGTAVGATDDSGTGTGAFTWTGVADGSNSAPSHGSAAGAFTWAGVAVGDNGEFEIPTDDEPGGTGEDDGDDLDFDPPLALPPAGFVERVIMRRSVIVPDLSAYPKDAITGQPHVTDAEYDAFEVVEAEVGVPHLIFPDNDSVNDVTYYRGAPLQGLRFLRREPFGDADADVTIPGITSMDTHPSDPGAPHPFTKTRANMEFVMRKSDGTSRRLWSGNVFTRSLGNDGRQSTMNLHALGSLYMADATRNRPIVSDDPTDYGYAIPRAFNLVTSLRYRTIPYVTTGILTLERGAWSDSPMGFALDGLAKSWTVGGRQWTVAKVVGTRRQYEMRLKKNTPQWTLTNGARGVYVDLEEDDNGRNVVFGHGVNADGGVWYNTKYPDDGSVRRLPLAADPRTQKWLYDDGGNVTGPNPDYNVNIQPREDDVDFGQNSKAIGVRSAQQIVDRESVPSFVGRITIETDPREGWRGDIQAGDKLTLIGYQGRDLILHVSDVEVSFDGSMPVTLTVDEQSRDAMTVAQIRERNKESRRDPALRPGNPNRRSRLEVDQIVPFDSESPAGIIPSWAVQGGQWNIKSIPFATAGRIAKVHFETGSPMAVGLFAYRPSTAHLNSLIGNPLTQDDPLKAHMNTLEGTFGLCAFWGQQGQRMGYSPGREDASDPFTGDFDEATGFDYVAQANARLYLAVYPAASTTVSGRCFPALVV